jgi:hypothetical protein
LKDFSSAPLDLTQSRLTFPLHNQPLTRKVRVMPAQLLKHFLDEHQVKYVTITHSPACTAQKSPQWRTSLDERWLRA